MNTWDDHVLRKEIRAIVDESTTPIGDAQTAVARRVHDRQRRRWVAVGTTCAALVLGAVGLIVARDGQTTDPSARFDQPSTTAATDPGETAPSAPDTVQPTVDPTAADTSATTTLIVEEIRASNGPEGTERVVVVFDREVPNGEIPYIEGFDAAAQSAPSYTTQDATSVRICGAAHQSAAPDLDIRTLDLLLPASWFATGSERYVGPILPDGLESEELFSELAKIIVCDPVDGVVQVAVMFPASTDASRITVDTDATSIRVEVASSDVLPILEGDLDLVSLTGVRIGDDMRDLPTPDWAAIEPGEAIDPNLIPAWMPVADATGTIVGYHHSGSDRSASIEANGDESLIYDERGNPIGRFVNGNPVIPEAGNQ